MQLQRLLAILEKQPMFPFPEDTPSEIPSWHRRMTAVIDRLAQPGLHRKDLELTIGKYTTIKHPNPYLSIRDYSLKNSFGQQFRGLLVLSSDSQNAPSSAVLVCPGRQADIDKVAGLRKADYPDRNVAERLAESGIATLVIDYGLDVVSEPQLLDRRDPAALLQSALAICGTSLLSGLIHNARAALRWLSKDFGIARSNLGIFGHSLGGAVALHTALLERSESSYIAPLCVASHAGTYRSLFGIRGTAHPAAALPGILRYAELSDLFLMQAPGYLQLQYGLHDDQLCPDDAARSCEAIQAGYDLIGAPDRFEEISRPMGHGTSTPDVLQFFAKNLGHPDDIQISPNTYAVPPVKVFVDADMRSSIIESIDQSLDSGLLTLGPNVEALEKAVGSILEVGTLAVSSGTAALEAALSMAGVAAGDTVLLPANTFFATASAPLRLGANIDFVDIELEGLGMDPSSLRRAFDTHPDVAAVIVVHIGGLISPSVHDVLDECARRGVPVIEDAAHAFGSQLHNAPAGSLGQFGAFSLYPTKIVTSGEGGLVTAKEEDKIAYGRRLRDHGRRPGAPNEHDCLGTNWRMSEPHAAIGLAQVSRVDFIIEERRMQASWYDQQIGQIPGVRRLEIPPQSISNYYKYIVLCDRELNRAALSEKLRSTYGVQLSGAVYETSLPDQPYFSSSGRKFSSAVSNSRWFSSHHLCLPIYPSLTRSDQERILEALRTALEY